RPPPRAGLRTGSRAESGAGGAGRRSRQARRAILGVPTDAHAAQGGVLKPASGGGPRGFSATTDGAGAPPRDERSRGPAARGNVARERMTAHRLLERERETGLLAAALDAAGGGRGTLVVVEGEPGAGKS